MRLADWEEPRGRDYFDFSSAAKRPIVHGKVCRPAGKGRVSLSKRNGGLMVNDRSVAALRLEHRRMWRYGLLKRGLDVACVALLAPVALPLLCVLAVAVRYGSPGPVFVRHMRVGVYGKPFRLYAFRLSSRVSDQEGPLPDDGIGEKTRAGRFLQRTNLEALPWLLNVFKGEMSVVGPRPERPEVVEGYTEYQRLRLLVPPGITGLWQISKHKGLPPQRYLEYDLTYVSAMNVWLDARILLFTLPLLFRKGSLFS